MTSRRSSGSMRADSAVEPTKSENITVTWRRSARSSGEALGVLDVVAASAEGALPLASVRRAAMASSSLQPVPDCRDAKLLQGLVRQARKDRLVYLVLAECRLVLSEAQAPQPDHNVHDGAPQSGVARIICRGSEGVQGGVGISQASQSTLRSQQAAQGGTPNAPSGFWNAPGMFGVVRAQTRLQRRASPATS